MNEKPRATFHVSSKAKPETIAALHEMANVVISATTLNDLCRLITGHRFAIMNEAELQIGIAEILTEWRVPFVREVALDEHGKSRIDFMIYESIGLEVKVKCSLSDVTRQLHRYAQSEQVTGLILVTNQRLHLRLPDRLNGKPLRIAHLMGNVF